MIVVVDLPCLGGGITKPHRHGHVHLHGVSKVRVSHHGHGVGERHTAEGPGYTEFGKLMFIDEELKTAGRFPEFAYGKNFPWPKEIRFLKERVEAQTGLVFGTCVCIWYPDGNIGVDYHSDQPAFGDTKVLPSISLGGERKFQLRENATGKVFEKRLETGSMIIMGEYCQERYEHCLPEDPECTEGRINLTFRQVGYD